MAKKNYYYVMVLTNEGPVFVTGLRENHVAEWDKLGTPKCFNTKAIADEVSTGLTANYIMAFTIGLKFELKGQAYDYKHGHLEWVSEE